MLEFEPGTKWNYSNSGYALLGYLIEKISRQSYQEFLRDNIFKPLGMNHSGYDSNSAVIVHRAMGYEHRGDGLVNAGYIDMTIPFAGGGLYSTTHDLLRWEQGLFDGKVLSAASLKKMTTAFKENYAMGLRVVTRIHHTEIAHNGEIEGFNTSMMYWPDDKLTVIVLTNVNPSVAETIATKIAALVVYGLSTTLPK